MSTYLRARRAPRAVAIVLAGAAVAALLAVAPQGAGPRFFHDDPLTHEPDTQDASKVQPWDIDLAVDLATNLFSRPGDKAVDVRARNINTIDEVPDSSWFTNRIGAHPVAIADAVRGPVDGPGPAGQDWIVTHAKESGFSPGFTIHDAKGETWFVQFDPAGFPEAATGAVMVANKIFWTLGYYQVESHLITVHPDRLKISEKATFRAPSGKRRPMRRGDIDGVFRKAQRNADGSYRAVAGRGLPGTVLGGFRYHGTRPDDPNDVVPHEHRRELRALKVFGAWTNLVDMKAGNTLDTLIHVDGRGVVRHYLQDVGSTFGSSAIGARDYDEGYDYLIDVKPLMKRALLFGLPLPRWATVPYPDEADIGRFEGKVFDPLRWKPRAPTAAFLRARPDDTFWAARRVAAFSDEMIRAIARTGAFSNPRTADALAATLIARRDRIVRAYLPAINPIVDVALSADGALTFANAAVDAGVAPKPASYAVDWARFDNATGATTPIGDRAVVTTPRASAPRGLPGESGAYVAVRISATDGPKPWTTPVHAYFRRTADGWMLVGLERLP
jgi:hypothetical protein